MSGNNFSERLTNSAYEMYLALTSVVELLRAFEELLRNSGLETAELVRTIEIVAELLARIDG